MSCKSMISTVLMTYCILFCGVGIAEIILGEICFGVRLYIVGILITIVSVIGMEAVHKRKPKQLLIFGAINLSAGIITLIMGMLILAVPAYYGGLNYLIKKKYTSLLKHYQRDESAKFVVDYFQGNFECCGVYGAWDYEITEIPKSCYHNGCVYQGGCIYAVSVFVKKWFYIANAVSVFLGALWTVIGGLAIYFRNTFTKVVVINRV